MTFAMNTNAFCFEKTNFIGMDLHSNNVAVCVVQNAVDKNQKLIGKVIARKTIALSRDLGELEGFLSRYCANVAHEATVESTYNWYRLADLFEHKNWNLRLADPTTVKRNKVKFSDDMTDAQFLAEQMRLNALESTQVLGKQQRAIRDLVRFRGVLVQDRARYKTIFKNFLNNQQYLQLTATQTKELALQCKQTNSSDCLMEIFDDVLIAEKAFELLYMIEVLTERIEAVEQKISAALKNYESIEPMRKLLQSIPGCGEVLSTAIAVEIAEIGRFKSARDFVSYCRLAPSNRFSNGKSKGEGNKKNGNAYLSWALTELANLATRYSAPIRKKYDRLLSKTNMRVRAIRVLAAKMARAVWQMIKKQERFNEKLCFNSYVK